MYHSITLLYKIKWAHICALRLVAVKAQQVVTYLGVFTLVLHKPPGGAIQAEEDGTL
jgi:hypothetical protein